ncbi:MAG: helix-turn-helix transcriptional regulator [Lachnospiraceae bacterium]|nr:helix-turn-helix transcriptional regulator [Lachnospiraceae bacterium]
MRIIDMKEIWRRIQERRKKLNLTQQEVYEKLNVSQNHYSRIENGHVGMSFEILLEICEILQVSTDYILTGEIHDTTDSPIVSLYNSCTFEQQRHILKYVQLFLEYESKK